MLGVWFGVLEFDMLIWFGFDVDLALYFDFHFDFEFGLNSGCVQLPFHADLGLGGDSASWNLNFMLIRVWLKMSIVLYFGPDLGVDLRLCFYT